MNILAPLPPKTRQELEKIPALIDKTFPLPGRFRSGLAKDVAELSRLLTFSRAERSLSYLSQPPLVSAYLRFFLPWNIFRLCRLLPGLDISLNAHDCITDLGCGPLTFTAALWICRPDLRALPLEFQCIDRSGPILDAGKKFFAALAGNTCTWKIHTTKSELNTVKLKNHSELNSVKLKPAALLCAINVFNEMYGDISRSDSHTLRQNAEKSMHLLEHYALKDSAILVAEPGFPRCGEFISLLRDIFASQGRPALSPCTHEGKCPFPGGISGKGKKRWCHFAFDTDDTPPVLLRLSAAAGIPKERAVLSYLLIGSGNNSEKSSRKGVSNLRFAAQREAGAKQAARSPSRLCASARIISDAFPLPQNRWGRYGCSSQGLVLLSGEKNIIEKTASGSMVNVSININEKDAKSGAFIVRN